MLIQVIKVTAQTEQDRNLQTPLPLKWSIYSTMSITNQQSLEPFAPEFGIRGGVLLPSQVYLGGRFGFVGSIRYKTLAILHTRNEINFSGEVGYEVQWWSVFSARYYTGVGILYSSRQAQGSIDEFNIDTRLTTQRPINLDTREWRPFISPGVLLTVTPFTPLSFGADARLAVFGYGLQGWLTFMLGLKF